MPVHIHSVIGLVARESKGFVFQPCRGLHLATREIDVLKVQIPLDAMVLVCPMANSPPVPDGVDKRHRQATGSMLEGNLHPLAFAKYFLQQHRKRDRRAPQRGDDEDNGMRERFVRTHPVVVPVLQEVRMHGQTQHKEQEIMPAKLLVYMAFQVQRTVLLPLAVVEDMPELRVGRA